MSDLHTKNCKNCHESKPLGDFHNKSSSADGKQNICKVCRSISDKKYYRPKPTKVLKDAITNPCQCRSDRCRLAQDSLKHGQASGYNNFHCRCDLCCNTRYRIARSYTIKAKFGISLEQYAMLFESQGGKCGICKKSPKERDAKTGRLKELAVDHDHRCCPGTRTCGKCIRGLLCSNCNGKLGWHEQFSIEIQSWLA